jgi:4-amino-4-deoxy-L-arabinose transferase-like glycosyltransferase
LTTGATRAPGRLAQESAADLIGLVALLAGAALLRTWLLGSPELFRDEASSWLLARADWAQIIPRSFAEPYPPLYPFALKASMGIVGDSPAALRALSVVAGLGLIVVTWLWTRAAVGRMAAFVAAGLVALSPLAIANARDARMYALEALFITVAWWLIWRLLTDDRLPSRRLLAIVASSLAIGAELWTLPTGIVAFGLQAGMVAITARQRGGAGARAAAWSLAAGALLFLPWLPRLADLVVHARPFWTPRPDLQDLAVAFGGLLGTEALIPVAAISTVVGVVLAGLGINAMARSRRSDGLATTLIIAGGIGLLVAWWLASLVRPAFDVRYMGPALPPFAIAIAAGVGAVAREARGWLRARRFVTAGAAIALALVGWSAVQFDARLINGPVAPAGASVALLSQRVSAGDLVLAADARSFFPVAYLVGRSSDPVAMAAPVRYWRSGSELAFTGGDLVPPTMSISSRARLDELVASPGGAIWLVAITDPQGELAHFVSVAGLGLTEEERYVVRHGTASGLVVRFAVARTP